jgi:hypothetical protein
MILKGKAGLMENSEPLTFLQHPVVFYGPYAGVGWNSLPHKSLNIYIFFSLTKEWANYVLWAKSYLPLFFSFANNILLECSHTHLFVYYVWKTLNYLLSDLSQEKKVLDIWFKILIFKEPFKKFLSSCYKC